ncbi:MAG: phosphoribosylaminoimidazolesuccinocarboxamide synthase [Turicibacter sp.]|jgi:phosphoribosylaminoimidazole-succinocarboxamide synthase|uniref:Phosphoribosylaminoimidazole-succinocarboxamide synthase n=1 Tax=Turicibacter faecis TaxID=2963365 RepID=A0ABN6ZKR5_9FIRM|nr:MULTISPECIES: phosphoribosylaminoimidazolesuccinocarboxamide synthase [unclassified Turicibacter]MCI8701011.1 phosphoribosylaminoimidazolesuccinocarboxamide synthase [Turicibacter sp.]BEH91931.1 phosphoribosylaminoimidazole-succinocarboxamide synthase [Turicibacter sp. TC023]MCU7205463.1 phosphoribosylaminoimidazolesuccinocarboxamide synthase [Turicibacter sp. TA25]MCU7208966.1 phosphoribosylaminoimidazolesuccinocarboxamide synthase [Turicibacter sp. 1E2]NCE79008.1 phosphoribosylaminoimidaz
MSQNRVMLYEGKAKQIFKTDDAAKVVIHYKDDATAFNGVKKSSIANKGILNNAITTIIFEMLEKRGIKTHFIEKINERDQLCHQVEIIPLEVIIRNVIAGSMAKRLGIEEGTVPSNVVYELCYKNDTYGDPLINDDHAVALGLATYEELATIKKMTLEINQALIEFFDKQGIRLIDFKIEFGRKNDGTIVLADEISPDTCRLWDKETNEKLDKDRFRRDLGNVEEAYIEILNRVSR